MRHGSTQARFDITWKSLFRILALVLLALAAYKLRTFLKMLLMAVLIAVALYPIVGWARGRGWPRWVGLVLANGLLLLLVLGIIGVIAPVIVVQARSVVQELPKFRERIFAQIGEGPIKNSLQEISNPNRFGEVGKIVPHLVGFGRTTLTGLFNGVLLIVIAMYLVADGPEAVRWVVAFFRPARRDKLYRTLDEAREMVFAYIVGNLITSALCAAYVFIILSVLGVPMAALLAIMAGIFDILPIIGFILSVVPAILFGLTVSPLTALLVFVLYGAYHLFENYVLVPRVYGRKLRLSTLAVLLSIIVAGVLAGLTGAIAVLPLVAAYPAIERIWLSQKLAPDTVKEHHRLAA